MQLSNGSLAISLLIALFSFSCSDPSPIGAELLGEDRVDLSFVDTLTMQTSTIQGPPPQVFAPFNPLNRVLCGVLEDPVFGASVVTTYLQARPQFLDPNLDRVTFDSLILILEFDTTAFYGDLDAPFSLDVMRVDEDMPFISTYNSDTSFAVQPTPLGSVTITPSALTEQAYVDYNQGFADTTESLHLRVRLSDLLGQQMIRLDTNIFNIDSAFLEFFKGIELRPAADNRAVLGFRHLQGLSGMHLYYSNADIPLSFKLEFSEINTSLSTFRHDYSGTILESVLSDPSAPDSITYLQSMAGVDTRIVLPTITSLNGAIVNFAEIELFVAAANDETSGLFPPVEQLTISYQAENGELEEIDDFVLASRDIIRDFGGILTENADSVAVYRMNLSTHLQDMIEGKAPNELFIRAYPKPERASRVRLYGAGHPQYAPRLKLTITELN